MLCLSFFGQRIKRVFDNTIFYVDSIIHLIFFRSSCSQMFNKIDVLKNFAKVTKNKNSFFYNKVEDLQDGTLSRKRLRHIPIKFENFFKKIYFIENAYELLLLLFEVVITRNDIKKFYIGKFVFRYNRYKKYIHIYIYKNLRRANPFFSIICYVLLHFLFLC